MTPLSNEADAAGEAIDPLPKPLAVAAETSRVVFESREKQAFAAYMIVFALVAIFDYAMLNTAVQNWSRGHAVWAYTIFMVPFFVLAFVLLCAAMRAFFAMFAPSITLSLPAGAITLGQRIDIDYAFTEPTRRIRVWSITLVGSEIARRNLPNNDGSAGEKVEGNPFCTLRLAGGDAERPAPFAGKVPLTLPADWMHSFESPNNEIVWQLRVQAEIAMLPDMNRDFRVVVLPPHGARQAKQDEVY